MNANVARLLLCNDEMPHQTSETCQRRFSVLYCRLRYIKVLNEGNSDAVLTSLPRQLHTLKTPAKKPSADMTSVTLTGLKAHAPHQSVETMKPFEWKVYKKSAVALISPYT